MATDINKVDLDAAFGEYEHNTHEDNKRAVLEGLIHERNLAYRNFSKFLPMEKTEKRNIRKILSSGGVELQAFQPDFTPDTVPIDFKPWQIPLGEIKVEKRLKPDQIASGIMDGMRKNNAQDRVDWGITEWALDTVIMQDTWRKLNRWAYGAQWAAPVIGTPGVSQTSFNGLAVNLLAASVGVTPYTTPIATGALTPATILAQVQTFAEGVPEEAYDEDDSIYTIWMSLENYRIYRNARRDQYKDNNQTNIMSGADYEDMLVSIDEFDNFKVDWTHALKGTSAMIASEQGNLSFFLHDSDSTPIIERHYRYVDFWWDFYVAMGVHDPRAVFINDQIAPTP